MLGVQVEEFGPLLDDDSVTLDSGTVGTLWTDRVEVTEPDVQVVARYKSGEQADRPAITRRRAGSGWPPTCRPGSGPPACDP